MSAADSMLRIRDLSVVYEIDGRELFAVKNAFIVGESGSGKSTFARAMMALLPATNARVASGVMEIDGVSYDMVDKSGMARLRGRTFAMVFQDPLSYLNPLMTIRSQIVEAIRLNDPSANVDHRVRELLDLVRLPQRCLTAYPHELSGGMRQRVLIAIALGCRPKVLIADEPTTALDVTTQAEILALIKDIKREIGMSLVLISHDLGVVSSLCERVFVMYGGYTIETGAREKILSTPAHPYTQALIHTARAVRGEDGRFVTLSGDVPRLVEAGKGCPFAPRCGVAMPQCDTVLPSLAHVNDNGRHSARCHMHS
jgi:oligopeptide/dipeptide ABC transporter ATP-binding protein